MPVEFPVEMPVEPPEVKPAGIKGIWTILGTIAPEDIEEIMYQEDVAAK